MKKYTYLTFIPILGIIFSYKAIEEEDLFENPILFFGDAVYQGLCVALLLKLLF